MFTVISGSATQRLPILAFTVPSVLFNTNGAIISKRWPKRQDFATKAQIPNHHGTRKPRHQQVSPTRRVAIEQTIKPIGSDELKAIAEKLFPFFDHPWRQTFFQFLEENSGSTIYRATTNDAIEILYRAEKDIGIWFLLKGVGTLEPAIGISWLMVRGVEVNGSIAMTHAVIESATTTVRCKGASRCEVEDVHLRSSQTEQQI
jgi:hypothetical protein